MVAMSAWYYNGNQLDIQNDLDNYVEFSTGELQILNLTESTAGYYVCVTTLDQLGNSYQTYSANVVVSIPGTSMCVCVCVHITMDEYRPSISPPLEVIVLYDVDIWSRVAYGC